MQKYNFANVSEMKLQQAEAARLRRLMSKLADDVAALEDCMTDGIELRLREEAHKHV